jgi:pilus assembly protein CpaC
VKVVEFNRSDLKQAGINLTTSTSRGHFSFGVESQLAPIGAAFELAASIVGRGAFNLDARIRLMQENGVVRVLAEPSLVAISGQSASFLAGGEVPVPVPSGLGATGIEYKSFGIGLRMTPTVLAADRIALKVAPEASDLDYANAVTINGVSVPAISTRRTETTVELGDGESFVIGGLVSRTTESNVSKVPFLGDLPVLGPFFKSMSHNTSERELLIVVTPHLVRPIARGAALPATPGEAREQSGRVWQDYLLGPHATDTSVPGFSR